MDQKRKCYIDDKSNELGDTALMEAVARGYSEIVKDLIKDGVAVNEADNDGHTALWHAAYRGYTETVKALINAGADLNKPTSHGATALMDAVAQGPIEIVETLIKAGADVDKVTEYGNTALMYAASFGESEIVHALIKAGADVHQVNRYGKTALLIATRRGDSAIITAIENFKTAHPTIIAIQENRMSILGITQKNAQEKTEAGYTTLMAAFAGDDIVLAKKLLEYGADIYAQDAYGRTALSCARSTTMVMDFIRNNALDIKRALGGVDGGYLVLRRAVEENNKELIQLILKAVPEIVGHDNSLLSLSDDITVIRLLLRYGIRSPSNSALQPHIQQEAIVHHILANTSWSYAQRLTMTVGDVKAWMGDYADMLLQANDHTDYASIIDQETMKKIQSCQDDTIKATEFLETDDHLLYTVYCAKVVREMKERKMSLDTNILVNLMESNMYFKSGYIDQALDRLLKTPEVIDVHAASYRIKLEELLQPLLMTLDALRKLSNDERLLEFLRRFMQDHITTAPEKSKDYQILLALTDNITPGTSDDLNKSIEGQIAEVQAFRQNKAGVESIFSDRWVKWVENWIMNNHLLSHIGMFSVSTVTDNLHIADESNQLGLTFY